MKTATADDLARRIVGPVASIPTPFDRDGAIDETGLRSFIDFVIEAGACAVMLTAGDSLMSILTDREVAQITRVVADQVRGRAITVAADRSWWVAEEEQFAVYARDVGADILMALPPDWAASCTRQDFVDYYAAVAKHIPVMIVTNVFDARGTAFGLETIAQVAHEVPGVCAVKDDVCGQFARKLATLVHGPWATIAGGQKQNHMDMLPYGCDAYLSTYIKFAPSVTQRYWAAIQEDRMQDAVDIITRYDMPFFDFTLALEGGFDAGVHGALELFGIAGRWRRPPYHSLTDAQMEQLAGFFHDLELL